MECGLVGWLPPQDSSTPQDVCLPTRVTTPLSQGYRPELGQSRELDSKRGQYYQGGLIGVLWWICELGRIDIMVVVSMLSCYVVSLWEGHLQQVFHQNVF